MKDSNSFLTTPVAVILGSLVVAVSILVSGGVIKVGNIAPTNAPGVPAQPQGAPKTEAEIIKQLKAEAGKLKLDQGKFDQCLDSGEKASLVNADLAEGSEKGVNGTPAFFVNGRLLSGALPFEQFKQVLDEELAGEASPSGIERVEVGVGNLPALGDENAKVTLIEFSDYQCPFCSKFYTETEGKIKKEYVDKGLVKFYYRDFPLTQIHPGAQKAAEAARCAGDQNKYWEYHDVLFQDQNSIF